MLLGTICTDTHSSQPPVPAKREQQDFLEADPHQRPVLEWLGVERDSAASGRHGQGNGTNNVSVMYVHHTTHAAAGAGRSYVLPFFLFFDACGHVLPSIACFRSPAYFLLGGRWSFCTVFLCTRFSPTARGVNPHDPTPPPTYAARNTGAKLTSSHSRG